MTTAVIRQKLYEYIKVADEKKVKAIFTMVEDQLTDFDWRNDAPFIAELDKRTEEYKTGKVKGVSWSDAKSRILASKKGKS